MAAARAQGMTPGQSSPSPSSSVAQGNSPQASPGQSQAPSQASPESPSATGSGNSAAAGAYTLNAEADPDDGREWGKLPPKVAKDIIEARRQGVAPEYRSAIESYYKAIADRARKDR